MSVYIYMSATIYIDIYIYMPEILSFPIASTYKLIMSNRNEKQKETPGALEVKLINSDKGRTPAY